MGRSLWCVACVAVMGGCLLPDVGTRKASSSGTAAPEPGSSQTAQVGVVDAGQLMNVGARDAGSQAGGSGGTAGSPSAPAVGGNGGGTAGSLPAVGGRGGSGGSASPVAGRSAPNGLPSDRTSPVEHAFAEWPMPDALPGAKNKPSYKIEANIVTDNVTGLIWQRNLPAVYSTCSDTYTKGGGMPGEACNWENAKAYCQSEALREVVGEGAWRLPSKIELESILDETRTAPTIDLSAFPGTPPQHFWTSTPHVSRGAWYVNFESAQSYNYVVVSGTFKVRCVRGAL